MAVTATSIRDDDTARDERTLHARMEWFSKKWKKDMDPGDAAEFDADLLLLIQAIHRDANRETYALLTKALAAMPPMHITNVLK